MGPIGRRRVLRFQLKPNCTNGFIKAQNEFATVGLGTLDGRPKVISKPVLGREDFAIRRSDHLPTDIYWRAQDAPRNGFRLKDMGDSNVDVIEVAFIDLLSFNPEGPLRKDDEREKSVEHGGILTFEDVFFQGQLEDFISYLDLRHGPQTRPREYRPKPMGTNCTRHSPNLRPLPCLT